MKNKEIEELLNKLSKISLKIYKVEPTYCEELITTGELSLLLSYIEQLEKENKILRENAEHNDKVVDKVNWENQQLKKSIKLFTDDLANMTNRTSQLEKQKDDVVDVLKIKIARYRNEEDYYLTIEDFEDLLRMLGEIDE